MTRSERRAARMSTAPAGRRRAGQKVPQSTGISHSSSFRASKNPEMPKTSSKKAPMWSLNDIGAANYTGRAKGQPKKK